LQQQPQAAVHTEALDEAALLAGLLQELLQQMLALQPGPPSGRLAQASDDGQPAATALIPQAQPGGDNPSGSSAFNGAELKLPQSLMQLLMKLPELAGRLAEKLSQLSGGGVRVALQGDSLTLLPARQLSTPWSVAANAAPGLPAVQTEVAVLPGIAPAGPPSPSAGWLFGQPAATPEALPDTAAQLLADAPAALHIDLPEEGLRLSLRPALPVAEARGSNQASAQQVAAAPANFELVLSTSGEDAAELRASLSVTRLDTAALDAALPALAFKQPAAVADATVQPGSSTQSGIAVQPVHHAVPAKDAQLLPAADRADLEGAPAPNLLRQTAVLDLTRTQPLLSSFVTLPDSVIGQQPSPAAKAAALLPGLDSPAGKAMAAELLRQSQVAQIKAELSAQLDVQKSVRPATLGVAEPPAAVSIEGLPVPEATPVPAPLPDTTPQVIQVSPQLLQFSNPAAGPVGYTDALRAMFPRIAELAQHYQQYGNGLYHAQLELDPPALGKVYVNIAVRGETVSLQLAVLSPASKEQLAAGSAQLRQSLQDAGLNVADMRIVSLDPEERDASGEKQTGGNQPGRQGQQGQSAEDARAQAQALKSAPRWEAALKTAGAA
jgi:flagellar hook-length control protein FliK